jgi:hypothetical protein
MNNLKFAEAVQAQLVNQYINMKRKLLRTNAHIKFNRTCQSKNIITNYAKIKINCTSRAAKQTQKQIKKLRINNGLIYLYPKKQNINNQLYKIHLKNAQYWQTSWYIIENNINQKLNEEASKHYHKFNNKINNLVRQLKNNENITNMQTFYPPLQNVTNIQFSRTEERLLNLGGKYNMGITPRKSLKQLVYETKNAIRQVNINQQEAIRYLATKNLQNFLSKQNKNTDYKKEMNTMKHIKQKLQQNQETILEADKGHILVVIYKKDLEEEVNNFIKDNDINELKTDPTQNMHKVTQNTIKQCKHIIDPTKRKYQIQIKPQAPNLKAKIKIYKPTTPIRPVINNIHAHKIAQHIHHKLKDLVKLRFEYNIINTIQFEKI